jgi:hypothetical protein
MLNMLIQLPQVSIVRKRDDAASTNSSGATTGYKVKTETRELPDVFLAVNNIIAIDTSTQDSSCSIVTSIGGQNTIETIIPLPAQKVMLKINYAIFQNEVNTLYQAMIQTKNADC